MSLTIQPIVELPLTTAIETANRAFTGYIAGDIHLTPSTFATMVAKEGLDLSLSQLALDDGQPLGFALFARRGATSRLGAYGIVPEAQGKGIGKRFLLELIQQARARGDQAMVLECFEQNTRAVRLYESFGFRAVRRLMGYEGTNLSGTPGELTPVDITKAAQRLSAWGQSDLPWQCSGATVMNYAPPNSAYRLGDSYAVVTPAGNDTLVIRALAVSPDQQRHGQATRLVSALIAAHPGAHWYVPQICPEAFGNIFLNNGLKVLPLNQFQMELKL